MQHSSLLSKHASDSALHKRGAHHSAMPRSVALSSSAMSHRRLPPHLDREGVLPPLHETSMSATSASRRGMSSHSESFYDGRDSKAHVHLGLSTSFSRVAGRVSQAEDARCSEVESLKRQIARLTQLRRDRDTYIQDLLADAEIAEKRHEAEMSRRLARSQREILERLTAQEEEHAQILKERSRSHEAAVAHLVSKHDRQMRELRNSAHTDGGIVLMAALVRSGLSKKLQSIGAVRHHATANVWINKNTRVICQGMTGRQGRARVALQAIVERHLGRGMLVVNDAKMWSALTARTSSDESNKPATPARARGAPKASAGRTVSSNSGNSASPAVAPESADAVAAGISAPAPSAAVSAVSCGSPVSCGHSGGSAGGETFGAVQQRSARSMDVLEPPPGLPIRGAKASCDSFEKAEEPSTEPGILHRPSGSESGNYEMAVIAALQGQWVHSATAGETYEVKGFHVLRTRMQHSRPEVRPFSLRWNVGENRLEWGLAGKFFLKPPDRTPMNAAIWVPSSGGGNGFSWYRKSEGKGGSISSSSPLVQPHVQTAASSVPSRVPFVLRSQSGGGKGKATRKGSFGHS
eukprot:TRINITY_DN22163_c2_g1_i3.p1 TRINITY_DN22163_c2_g1~~TRINITY_DN22163_c2_g1_i3.p1  ORF type:complete len:580 (+),score=58.69 TRINITY_DN22163_c2_g1_i3:148-1887(+)